MQDERLAHNDDVVALETEKKQIAGALPQPLANGIAFVAAMSGKSHCQTRDIEKRTQRKLVCASRRCGQKSGSSLPLETAESARTPEPPSELKGFIANAIVPILIQRYIAEKRRSRLSEAEVEE